METAPTFEVKPPSEADLVTQTDEFALTVKAFEIKDLTYLEKAAELRNKAKRLTKMLNELRFDITRPLDEEKAAVIGRFKVSLDIIDEIDTTLKNAIIKFDDEQKEIAAKAAEELRLIEEKKAAVERACLEAKAVAIIATTGDEEEAEKILDKADAVVAEVVTFKAPSLKPFGVTVRDNWKARVTDAAIVPRDYCSPDQTKLDQAAKAAAANPQTVGKSAIPGVEFWNDKQAVRR